MVYSYGFYDASLGLTVTQGTDGLIENWTNNSNLRQSNTVVTFNAWNHIAISRDATTTTFYLNGADVGSVSSTNVNAAAKVLYIGGVVDNKAEFEIKDSSNTTIKVRATSLTLRTYDPENFRHGRAVAVMGETCYGPVVATQPYPKGGQRWHRNQNGRRSSPGRRRSRSPC